MKLFELYNKQPLSEDCTVLTASIKLCEGMVTVLNGMKLTEAPVKDPTALAVKKVVTDFLGSPYSSARIAKGKIHRLSIPISDELSQMYRAVPLSSIDPRDKEIMRKLKSQLYSRLQQAGIDTTKVDIRYHVGTGVYMSVRTQIEEEVAEAEYDNGIDFEPQPDFKNVKGVNIDDTGQNISYQQNTRKQENEKLNKAWVMLLSKMQKLDKMQRRKLRPHLQKVANAAAKRNFTLTPSAEQVFGL